MGFQFHSAFLCMSEVVITDLYSLKIYFGKSIKKLDDFKINILCCYNTKLDCLSKLLDVSIILILQFCYVMFRFFCYG